MREVPQMECNNATLCARYNTHTCICTAKPTASKKVKYPKRLAVSALAGTVLFMLSLQGSLYVVCREHTHGSFKYKQKLARRRKMLWQHRNTVCMFPSKT